VSALWAGVSRSAPVEPAEASALAVPPNRHRLRAVPQPAPRLARVPFIGVLIAVFGLGMAGLLMLNTSLQNQAFQSRALDRQASELAYRQADLESQISQLGAPQELARRASALGLRPNPQPAFLEVPTGRVIGDPQAVRGDEVPQLVIKTPAEKAADRAAKQAKHAAAAAKKQQQAAHAAAQARVKALADQRRAEAQARAAAAKAKAAAEQKKVQQ
jgi:hypothetical protein